jgi:response regulator RpfG family c-di-GMP phosphodiesterase
MMDESWLATQLAADGAASPERLAAARARQGQTGTDLATALWEGGVDETALLRAISIAHRTSYVTIDKLSRARIARDVIERVPVDVAQTQRLLPLSFDAHSRTLSVVSADPSSDSVEVARRVSMAAQVRAYVALPGAVDAAIRRFYLDDASAFADLERPGRPSESVGSEGARPVTLVGPAPAPLVSPAGAGRPGSFGAIGGEGPGGTPPKRSVDKTMVQGVAPALASRPPGSVSSSPSPSPSSSPAPGALPDAPARRGLGDDDDDFGRSPTTSRFGVLAANGAAPQGRPARDSGAHAPAAPGQSVPIGAFLETLKVLVSVGEMGPVSWRQGHAAEVARQSRRLAERVGLGGGELAALTIAAYLHDVGKPDDPHLTLLGLAMVPDQRALAERVCSTPLRLFEGAELPDLTIQILAALYERADGTGLPRRRQGREIPLGARILALVDAYVDLTMNPFGAAGGNVAPREAALALLRRHKDSLFDGALVDIFQQLISGEDLRQQLLGDRPRVLLADADAEVTSLVELKLAADGCEVRVARSTTEALRCMAQWAPDLVVAEIVLEPGGGLALLEEARRHRRTADVPFFFLSERASAPDLERGFALGAADYLTKPVALELLLAKARRVVTDRARHRDAAPGRRVAGSLAEMPVSDLVEVLGKGKKTGVLHLVRPARAERPSLAGDVFLDGGKIVHAALGANLSGHDALYRLLHLGEGEFAFEAGIAPPSRSIDAPTEWLLLEAMRRLDEGPSSAP